MEILANVTFAGEHIGSILVSIITILSSIATMLASVEQVNTPNFMRDLVFWFHRTRF